MGRREDLERLIRGSYDIVRQYESLIQAESRAEETSRAQLQVDRQWSLIEGYLTEYLPLVEDELPPDIAQVANHFRVATPPPEIGQPVATRAKLSRGAAAPRSPSRSRLFWAWAVRSVLALVVLGGSFLGIRAALQSRTIPLPTSMPVPKITPTPTLEAGATQIREKDGAVMVYVPAGEFWMGSMDADVEAVLAECSGCERELFTREQPRRKVSVDAFWIDRTEVTNAQYRRCVDAGVCRPPREVGSDSRDRYYGNSEFDHYPVIYVSWDQARVYAEWVGGRLPTEAEWEYACRGSNAYIYPWGNSPPNDSLLNYNGKMGDTATVGSYPDGESWIRALDMTGNVWEWTQSLYKDYPYELADGRENLSAGGARVVRGGSFINSRHFARCAVRGRYNPDPDQDYAGFRVCVVAQ